MKLKSVASKNYAPKLFLTIVSCSIFISTVNCQDVEKIFQQGNSLDRDGNYKEALIYVDSSLRIDSSLYQRFHFRADIKAKLGMYESAIDDMTRCITKCACPTRKWHVASYYLDRANLQLLNNNSSAALSDANKSISVNPNEWTAYNFRSSLLVKSGNLEAALADLDRSIKLDDNQAGTFIARAELRKQMGDIEGACSDLSKVVAWGIDRYEPWIKENCK